MSAQHHYFTIIIALISTALLCFADLIIKTQIFHHYTNNPTKRAFLMACSTYLLFPLTGLVIGYLCCVLIYSIVQETSSAATTLFPFITLTAAYIIRSVADTCVVGWLFSYHFKELWKPIFAGNIFPYLIMFLSLVTKTR